MPEHELAREAWEKLDKARAEGKVPVICTVAKLVGVEGVAMVGGDLEHHWGVPDEVAIQVALNLIENIRREMVDEAYRREHRN